MRLSSVRFENFRCFRDLSVELHPRLNVIVGDNGAGKTAFLRGVTLLLGAALGETKLRTRPELEDRDRSVHVEAGSHIVTDGDVHLSATGLFQQQIYSWAYDGHATIARAIADVERDMRCAMPVVVHYPADRSFRASSWPPVRPDEPRRSLAYNAWFQAGTSSEYITRWMLAWEQERLEQLAWQLDSHQPIDVATHPMVDEINRIVRSILPNAQGLASSLRLGTLFLDTTDRGRVPFDMLPDGARTLIGLAADIAARAQDLSGDPFAKPAAADATGVVLIDEIDLHLHPRWQRRVLGDLTRIFPNIQFIVTTHSPQVIASAPPEAVRVLRAGTGEVGLVDHSLGRDTNAILRDIMGDDERPPDARLAVRDVAEAIDRGDVSAARRGLDALTRQLGPVDQEVLRLGFELRDLETFGAADHQGT